MKWLKQLAGVIVLAAALAWLWWKQRNDGSVVRENIFQANQEAVAALREQGIEVAEQTDEVLEEFHEKRDQKLKEIEKKQVEELKESIRHRFGREE